MDGKALVFASVLATLSGPARAAPGDETSATPASQPAAVAQPTGADPTGGQPAADGEPAEEPAEEPGDRQKFEKLVGNVFGNPSYLQQVERVTKDLQLHDRVAAVWILQQANNLKKPGAALTPEAINQFRETVDQGIQDAYDRIGRPPPENLNSVLDGLQHLYVSARPQGSLPNSEAIQPPKADQPVSPPALEGGGSPVAPVQSPTPESGGPTGPVEPWLGLDAVTRGNPNVVRSLAHAQWANKDYRGVYDNYSRLYAGGDRSPEVRRWRGLAAERSGDFELAHREAQAALAADSKDRVALSLLRLTENKVSRVRLPEMGRLADGSASPDAARVAAGSIPPGGAPASANGGGRAEATIQETQRRFGGDPRAGAAGLVREARTYLNLKDLEGAVLLATKAVELDPRNAAAFHVRAVAQSQLGRYEQAARDASASLALVEPSQGLPALKTRAWALNSLRRYPEALQDSLRAKSIKPGDGFVLMSEARALGGLGRRAEMLERLREAARVEPERYRPLYDAALQLPSDADTEALFTGAAAGTATPVPPPASEGGWRRLRLIAYCLAGGLLIALGLSHFGVSDKATTTARRLLGADGERQAPQPAPAASSESGFWSRYDDVRELARGGMGIVYEATDRGLGRRVAVKKMREELRTDPRERERFLKEARTVAALQHPNIVQIYQVAEDGFDAFLVFEHVDGETLHDRLRRAKRLELAEAVDILRGVAAAVEHAHDHGLTHRDLKPSNIMIDKEGVVKVMDFGIARQAKDAVSKLSMTNTVCGTPPYMAPEQEQGLVCKESDVFSLGVVAYELLSGTLPFEGAPGAMLLAKMSARFDPLSSRAEGLPAGVDQALARALCPDPAARFRRPSEFVQALGALVDAKA